MKTIKITLITALIALGAILFGQVQYINTGYTEKSSRFENLVNNLLSLNERTERDGYKEPVVYMSYTVNLADVVYEENYGIEAWMASPFESSMEEADLSVEEWMSSPFESSMGEADLSVEEWMSSPFESSMEEADLSVEEWMSSPFESSMGEADLLVEKWMTMPFEAAEHIEIESWMTAPF